MRCGTPPFRYDFSELRERNSCFHETFFYSTVLPTLSSLPPTLAEPALPPSGRFSRVCQWPPEGLTVQIARPFVPLCLADAAHGQAADSGQAADFVDIAFDHLSPEKKTRSNFSPHQRRLLEQFFYEHRDHPYADRRELEALERATNLTRRQIRVFMTNARMRKFSGFKKGSRSHLALQLDSTAPVALLR
jgi:hypothetical protein